MFGIDIVVCDNALKDSDVRNFPASRHRSKRIEKKLLKRFGSVFKKMPCAFHVKATAYSRETFVMHPSVYEEFKKKVPTAPKPSFMKWPHPIA